MSSLDDELVDIYTAVRAGKDPNTGEPHVTEKQFVERIAKLIESLLIEEREKIFQKGYLAGLTRKAELNKRKVSDE